MAVTVGVVTCANGCRADPASVLHPGNTYLTTHPCRCSGDVIAIPHGLCDVLDGMQADDAWCGNPPCS